MKILKNFVVFEGGDGSGTTTQLHITRNLFAARPEPPPLFCTFEPTDGPIGRLIRQGLRGETPLNNESVAFLFAADRNEHLYGPNGIEERCGRGELVICDRYLLSSLVYQGITCGEELPAALNRGFPVPELTLYFDIDPQTAQKRMENRSQKEIYETLEFQALVRGRYQKLLPVYAQGGSGESGRTETIDASLSVEEVSARVWSALKKLPILKG